MERSSNAFQLAFDLILQAEPSLLHVVGLSIYVSGMATLIAIGIALLTAGFLVQSQFFGKSLVLAIFRTLTGLPAVVVGLAVYLLLSRSGPLGVLGLLFTPTAMIIAQTLLIAPLAITLSYDVLDQRRRLIGDLLTAYQVPKLQSLMTLAFEARFLLMTVALTCFGRAIAEVGAVMIVGGNIEGFTRVMTTAIALETSRGDLPLAMALGLILLLIALSVNLAIHLFAREKGAAR